MLKKKKAAVASARVKGARPLKLSDAAEQEKAAARVKDIIAALQKTAARRRDQSNQKKSSSVSSAWIQSFPGLSNSLKESLVRDTPSQTTIVFFDRHQNACK
jgi:hypothetical protein